jgi:hypothetical protein
LAIGATPVNAPIGRRLIVRGPPSAGYTAQDAVVEVARGEWVIV